jgi:uncharacterized heparinase superfamily protein
VLCRRQEDDGNLWLELSHDGYQQRFGSSIIAGSTSRQQARSCAAGDKLVGPAWPAFTIRFHLHHRCRLRFCKRRLGSAEIAERCGLRLRSSGGSIVLEQSVYLGRGGEIGGANRSSSRQDGWARRRASNGSCARSQTEGGVT